MAGTNDYPSDPGKTAPRLLLDLRQYDPLSQTYNALTDFPPRDKKPTTPQAIIPNHIHALILKPSESNLPGNYPQAGVRYNVATICKTCRVHIDVRMHFPERSAFTRCGPDNPQYPLHHFQYHPNQSKPLPPLESRDPKHPVDSRTFICSASTCSAILTVVTRLPFFSNLEVDALVDKKSLEERHRRGVVVNKDWATDPVREPFDVFSTIRTYMANALEKNSRAISKDNRRLIQSFGDLAGSVLSKGHFELSPDGSFYVPPEDDTWDATNLRWRDITDILEEANILMDFYSQGREFQYRPQRAEVELNLLLACLSYESTMTRDFASMTSTKGSDRTFHPNYAALGAVGDFKDSLLVWAYDQQKIRDPNNAPYYLDCLVDLANGRGSEALQLAVAQRRSKGEISTYDIHEAYKHLHLNPHEDLDDDVIIGKFRAFIADAPRQEAQLRQSLHMIGVARRSHAIIQTADNSIVNVHQAYQYLNAEETTDDHFILTLCELKIKDQPQDEYMAKEALRLIAEDRNSSILMAFLHSGRIYEQPLDVSTAYARLEIPRDESITDETIIQIYQIRIMDGAANLDLQDALRAIGEDRNSNVIRSYLRTGEVFTQLGKSDWPVGLENIGNTCYLNSLLQYYFTIQPLRSMILQFDLFQEDMNEESLQQKRVGGRKLTLKEIERAKKFVSHLRTLFNNMITSRQSSVTPEHDLAYLALVSSKEEAKEGKRNGATDDVPPLITIDDSDGKTPSDARMDIETNDTVPTTDDAASEVTLVENPDSKQTDEDFVMIDGDTKEIPGVSEDKENLPPRPEPISLNEARPVLQDTNMKDQSTQNDTDTINPQVLVVTPPPEPAINPDKPPPIPPRPSLKSTSYEDKHSFMFGRQQDVAECIENVMFQIEAAVKPEEIDENGEQIDLVKKLFYGKTKQSLQVLGSTERRSKIELFSHLLIDVAEGSRDIYSAIDSVFDVSYVNLEGKDTIRYLSICELPPVLQFQVQRVQFDRSTGRAYKSTAHLKFPETIYMDRYLDSADGELQAKREEAWAWKTEIANLEKRKNGLTNTSVDLEAPYALGGVKNWLENISESEDKDLLEYDTLPDILKGLDDGIRSAAQELEEVEAKLKALQEKSAVQFDGYTKHGYRIHSVFIHRGSATFGHYWIYIYDFQQGFWRKYNDGYVTKVEDEREVFNQDEINPATPYFLVFVREDQVHFTESVKREILV